MMDFVKESKPGAEAKKAPLPPTEDPEAPSPSSDDNKLRVNVLGSSQELGYYVALKSKLNDTRIKNQTHFLAVDEYRGEGSLLTKRSRKDFEIKESPMVRVEPVIKTEEESQPLDIPMNVPDDLVRILQE